MHLHIVLTHLQQVSIPGLERDAIHHEAGTCCLPSWHLIHMAAEKEMMHGEQLGTQELEARTDRVR